LPTRHTISWRSSPIDWPTAADMPQSRRPPAKNEYCHALSRKAAQVARGGDRLVDDDDVGTDGACTCWAANSGVATDAPPARDRIEDVGVFFGRGPADQGASGVDGYDNSACPLPGAGGNPPSRSTFRQQLCSASRLRSCRRLTGGGRICAGGVARAAGLP
jgi:hypothetical protein